MLKVPQIRKGQPSAKLSKEEYKKRWSAHFSEKAFLNVKEELEKVFESSWDFYEDQKKYTTFIKTGDGFENPDFEVPTAWYLTKQKLDEASRRYSDPSLKKKILIVSGSDRNEHTCPSEVSKTFRLAELARERAQKLGLDVTHIDLSRMTAEYGKMIYPCKGCVSTAMPLCHWPCSCYPNESLGQVNDWMNELYPEWVSAHGIFIITPVYWYQVPSVLKLMLDRLVCADGGNPDMSSTQGKNATIAKKIELEGWNYPRHLEGRAFSVFVHGDAEGASTVKQNLVSLFLDMKMVLADPQAQAARYIGYMSTYAKSHEDLEGPDKAIFKEVENCIEALCHFVSSRKNETQPTANVEDPRPK